MLASILAALVPDGLTSGWSRRVWKTLILLFPFALVGGVWLEIRVMPRPPVQMKLDKETAIRIARDFLIHQGLAASSWSASVGGRIDQKLLHFTDESPEPSPLWKFTPPVRASVMFRAPSGSAHVLLSVDGRVLGFDLKDLQTPGPAVTEPQARRLAEAQLPMGLKFGEPAVTRPGGAYEYLFRSQTLDDAEIKAEVHVEGARAVYLRLTPDLEPGGARGSHRRKPPGNDGLASYLQLASILFFTVIALYSLYRYGSRTIQQEVSHRRGLGVALLCTAFCVIIFYTGFDITSQNTPLPLPLLLVIFAVLGLCGGALLAAAYGSGEGDVREAYPGKLTSLDALLTGRIFSRNVGVSLLFGLAVASWLIVLSALVDLVFHAGSSRLTPELIRPLMPLHWIMPFLLFPMFAVLFTAAGVMQPLAFLHRNWKRAGRWRLPALVLCTALVSFVSTEEDHGNGFLPRTAIFVAALLVPFFYRDLMATLVCVAAFLASLGFVAGFVVLPDEFGGEGISRSIALLAIVVFAACAVRYGKTWTEEQVRPTYARHIAERQALEAEVSAAREAQLRLLPQCAPNVLGLSIAACCVPAEIVGGDFYDFFPLGEGRIGIFIAEGNGRGLAAALSIALAKGFLMHCVGKVREPVELLMRLETALGSILESSSAETDLAFAVVDSVAGEVRYARTGDYPKVLVASRESDGGEAGPVQTERWISVKGRSEPIAEGSAPISAGDHVLLFTNGVARRLAQKLSPEDGPQVERAICSMTWQGDPSAESVQRRMFSAGRAPDELDDLTAVVIQVESAGATALDVVA